MSKPLRSKSGCWTCRLRKKKCDESKPACSTCTTLTITCYGYGPRPKWMDHGSKEQEIAKHIKESVKAKSRQDSKFRNQDPSEQQIGIAPKVTSATDLLRDEDLVESLRGTVPVRSTAQIGPRVSDSTWQVGLAEENRPSAVSPAISIPTQDFLHIMHFLDHVFPLQFPLYRASVLDGGRGWLLSSLLRSEAPCHAALALSVYHRRISTLGETEQSSHIESMIKQAKYLETSIRLVRERAHIICMKNGSAIAMAVLELMLFELFTNHGISWQPHIKAFLSMFMRDYDANLAHFSISERAQTILRDSLKLAECEASVMEEVASFRFLTGTAVWLDVIHSITSGTRPRLSPEGSCNITLTSQTKLETFFGCRNWVVLQIGKISALHVSRITRPEQEGPADTDLKQTATDIQTIIDIGLRELFMESIKISNIGPLAPIGQMPHSTLLVTNVYAFMAAIYLHIVVNGFRNLSTIYMTISAVLHLLRTHDPTLLYPGMVAPLFVIGCVARPEDERLFENIFNSPLVQEPSLQHRGRILATLRKIWDQRKANSNLEWSDCLNFTGDLLLF